MTLDEAIQDLLDRGHADPHIVARTLIQNASQEWLVEQLVGLAPEMIATRARIAIHRLRGTAPSERPKLASVTPLRGNKRWCVRGEWKFEDDLTASDCRAIAERYEQLQQSMGQQADKFRRYAELMEEHGIVRLGGLDVELRSAA